MNKVIKECPDDTAPYEMEGFVNDEDDYEKLKTAENKNEGLIHRDITENEK